ncbi:MAG: transposase, partial [Deltaproteobacteria bacterium]|nr:transposase [Deltaproteobacteria bacterium]
APRAYRPRTTASCDAVAIVRRHFPAFLERIEHDGGVLPKFVRDEFDGFVTCGDFERGFLVTACRRCGEQLRVPFSCKVRGFCPSCLGRRMSEGAALLVDRLLPRCGYRQWVLSFGGSMAVRLGYDATLLARVSRCFARAVMGSLRRRTARHHGLRTASALHAGMLVVVQRFRYDLGLFVHLHALATDGVFESTIATDRDHDRDRDRAEGVAVRWLAAPAATEEDLAQVLTTVHRRLGRVDDGDEVAPALVGCAQLSLDSTERPSGAPPPRPLEVSRFGMSLHAASVVDGRDRKRLERMLRYLLRPPFAHDAVRALPDGRVRLVFKAPTRSGATHVDLEPDRFLARLVGLVPPPRQHQVRYFGVFSNHHTLRASIRVAQSPSDALAPAPTQVPLFDTSRQAPWQASASDTHSPAPSRARIGWAKLLARVFAIDVTVCRRCGGALRVLAAITDADEIARLLHGARPPPRPSAPGQLTFFSM